MQLPAAEELRAIFAAAREHGVTRLRIAETCRVDVVHSLELEFQPSPPAPTLTVGAQLVEAINREAPIPDPIEEIKAAAARNGGVIPLRGAEDALEVLARGGRLTHPVPGDPTEAA